MLMAIDASKNKSILRQKKLTCPIGGTSNPIRTIDAIQYSPILVSRMDREVVPRALVSF